MRPGRILRDLLYPPYANCICCQKATGCDVAWLCPTCAKKLAENSLGEFSPAGIRVGRAVSAHWYGDVAAELVKRLKYRGRFALAESMARDMARAAEEAGMTCPDCVCAVPMHKFRRYRRGYNQAEALARQVAEEIGAPYQEALTRVRATPQQARLSGKARRDNVRDAFRADGVVGKRVLLIDDVYTTGATAGACAMSLLQAGATRVEILVYARTQK